jgi:hypothetical protein
LSGLESVAAVDDVGAEPESRMLAIAVDGGRRGRSGDPRQAPGSNGRVETYSEF